MVLTRVFLSRALSVHVSFFLIAVGAGIPSAHANNCQQWLDAANESERLAAAQAGNRGDAARFRANAQNMRLAYNRCIAQENAQRGASQQQYLNDSIDQGNRWLEQKRRRDAEEARQRELEAEMERRARERDEAMRASEKMGASVSRRLRDAAKARKEDAAVKACVQQQSAAVEHYMATAQQCLVNTRLIASFNYDEPYIEPGTDPNTWGRLTPPRWKISGTRASPVCELPLKVDAQYESFAECTRAYACAAQAAQCTAKTVARTGADCNETAKACLARFPVPVNLAEGQTPPPAAVRPSGAGPSARPGLQGGISGPSGRGGPSIPSTSAK